jgi:hypothetical protein
MLELEHPTVARRGLIYRARGQEQMLELEHPTRQQYHEADV